MKNFVLATTAALLLATSAQAAEMNFPSDAPVATITIPDSWNPKETETGIDATSDDNSIYLAVDVADAKDTDAVVKDAVEYLAGQGVTVDQKTAKQTAGMLNGMVLTNVNWDGTDKDGPVTIGLAAAAANAEKVLVITYWGTKGEQEKNDAAMTDIVKSLKPVAQ
ncbi:MAG: hypothetical protein JWM58_948 [Rhizobium sp.]|nr:hypothetical protein [Rhizobium sp.]